MLRIYHEGDSFLHRLNPLSKLSATAPVLVFLALVTDPWTPTVFILLCASITVVLGRIPPVEFLRVAAPLLLLVLGFVLIYPFAVSGAAVAGSPILFEVGPLAVREAGIIFGLSTALRVLSIFALTLLFVLTTDSQDFVRALVQQWRLPYRLGYGALAAYRFVPRLGTELNVIRAAHKVRGISDRGGIRARYDQLRRYAVPLLASAIRHAERVALAMDSRAFGAYDTRTYYRRLSFGFRDWLFVFAFWLVSFALVLVLREAGLLGPLVLLQAAEQQQ